AGRVSQASVIMRYRPLLLRATDQAHDYVLRHESRKLRLPSLSPSGRQPLLRSLHHWPGEQTPYWEAVSSYQILAVRPAPEAGPMIGTVHVSTCLSRLPEVCLHADDEHKSYSP